MCFSEGNLNLYFGSLCRLMADFLLPHQRRAVAARLSVKKGDEFTYDMPTGSGKSHLMQWEIKQAGSSRRILVVFPRLALLSQFYTRYVVDLSSVPVLVACTDQKDVRDTCDEDKADHCAGREARRRLKRSAGQTSILVLTTYVSLGVVLAECHTPFDLTLLDEAHHRSEPTVSATILEKRGHLGFVVNFSATPSEECGGPRFTYPFREAVDDGVIRDFTVHFIYVDKKTAGRSTAENVRRIGELTGNTKCMAFTSFAKADVEHRTSVSKAQKDFERTTKGRPWFVGGITAELDPRKRREFLQKFASADRSVLVSCRTLGEGIDVPGVNCVTFVDPRSSRREVMQIIGRALRVYRDDAGTPLPHQPDSTVVVPVVVDVKEYCALPDDEARDAYLRDQAASTEAGGSYETVLAVASSLKEQDQDLVELCFLYPAGPKTKEAVRSVRRARDLQGYRVVEVLRDGNCFFRSLERYVGKGCFEIRQEVVDELLRMPASERFEWGLEYDEAVERFRRDGEWANDVMDSVPVVAARLYGLDLGIFTDHTEEPFERYGSPGGVEVNLQLLDGHYNVLEPKDPATPPARKQPRRVHRRRFRGHFDPACKVLWSLQSEALSRGLAVVEHRLERLGVYVPSVEEKVEALCSLGSRPAQRKTPFPGNVVLDNPEGLPVADWNPGMFLKQLSGNWHPEKAPGTKLLEEQKKRVEALPWFQEVLEEWKAGWDRKTTLYHPSPTEKLEALCSLGSRSPLRKTPFPENVVLDNPEGLPVADWNPGMFLQHVSGNWLPEKVPSRKLSEEQKRRLEALPWFQEVLEGWKAGWDRKATLYHPSPTEKLAALCSLGRRPPLRNTHFPDDVTLDNPQGLSVADWNPGKLLQHLANNFQPGKTPGVKLSEEQKERVQALPWFQEVLEGWKRRWVVAQTESTEPELPSSREELNVDSAPRATPQRPSAPRRRSLDEVEAAVERELALLTVEELRDQLRQMKVREREASFRSYQGLNKGSKEVVNRLLAENLPAAGAVVVLDAEDFGTSTVLGPGVADRLVIPQRDPEVYEGMRTHPVFGHALIPGDLVHLEPDGPVGLVYADLMGSVKEARKVLARLAEWPLTHNAVVAVSVSCRDGEEADFTNQFSVKLLQSIHETFPGSSNLTPGVVLVYGEKVRMATVVVRLDNFTGLRRFNEEGQLPAGKK